ncbi:hypothetical protein WJX79_007987 [Trebouxia sp. C0005]
MPRDMSGTGRYPPVPKHQPTEFYGSVRLGDPERLFHVMSVDPYFLTQNNGAGAPIHFATTYKQLDMLHHLLNNGAEVNQRDDNGLTALHRAAHLAQYDGYLQIYEYLLSRGADPNILSEDYEPYLNPGKKSPVEVAIDDEDVRNQLRALEKLYAHTPKCQEPHPDIGCWQTLYDYGPDAVKSWAKDYKHPYPEEIKRARDLEAKKRRKAEKKAQSVGLAIEAAAPSKQEVGTARKTAELSTPIAFVFPGQGSQAVGMLQASKELPAVKQMLKQAEVVLGYDLLQLCLEGPKEKLDDTVYSQPALFVAGLAAVEKLRQDNAQAVDNCSATAGLSLGEYCALVFAGVLSFEDGLKVVKARGESMAAAATVGRPHGMLSIVGLQDKDIQDICKQALAQAPAGTICQMANFLFPQGRVVSGHRQVLTEVQALATAKGAMKVAPLSVSGAFHTPLMQPAQDKLKEVLRDVTLHAPRVPVISNVTGLPMGTPEDIQELLARQLVEPVQWETALKHLIGPMQKSQLYELGPGQQIKAMCKRISPAIVKAFTNVLP